MNNYKLNLLGNLCKLSNSDPDRCNIHTFLNIYQENGIKFFQDMNSAIYIDGFKTKEFLLEKAKEYNVYIRHLEKIDVSI